MSETYLTLLRLGIDGDGNEKGLLKVFTDNFMAAFFSTIENKNNLRYSSLRVGPYEMKHDMLTHSLKGKLLPTPKRCLRPTEERIKHVLIHPANDATDLQGCIAPGLFKNFWTFEGSTEAMALLFEALGGYAQGRLITLKVLSNATGVGPEETKETWWRTAAQPG
jgi:hypothetical protein